MSKRPWIQPQLDGGAIKSFVIAADFTWPMGWEGHCKIRQEGLHSGYIEVSRISEADTLTLAQWLKLVSTFVAESD